MHVIRSSKGRLFFKYSSLCWLFVGLLCFGCGKDDNPSEPELTIPASPEIVFPSAEQLLGNCVLVDWDQIEDAQYYEIRIATNESFSTNSLVESRYVEEHLFADVTRTIFDLSNGDYYLRMSAGNAEGESDWCERISFSVEAQEQEVCYSTPEQPLLVLPDNGGNADMNNIALKWTEVDEATHYTVQFASDEAFTSIEYERGNLIGIDHNVQSQTSVLIYWRVRAVHYNVEGPWSEVWSFTAM